ncbi:bifunctional 5,10-methylenetetrahydrofolate dehydrogenase/5,10-methenyltetrahydrofolate cyclohydrolase [Candidatus Peregrinibacteria bacterium]|nr:bifunctional 5,10-methylenetetrahydrofolate dehydrogenase/5,10-methenyltetrahydrofolate cyclohydrolase [Candidatus Peregrinibacteria bacterium]
MNVLDGKKTASELYESLRGEVESLREKGVNPKLVIVQVGDDPASSSYIRSKQKASEKVGMDFELMHFSPDELDTEKLIAKVHELNKDETVNGILVQLPLPDHIYEPEVTKAIDPQKDVDGFTAYNLGKMFLSKDFEDLAPCTPSGIMMILDKYGVEVEGKEAVVVGRSNIVGKPISVMLLNRGATVTTCHSRTKDLAFHTKRADILVVAIGKEKFIRADMVKDGAVVVDVGINRTSEGKIVGDVDFEAVSQKVSAITPVPGGCGPMTVACLIQNVVKAAKKQHPNL